MLERRFSVHARKVLVFKVKFVNASGTRGSHLADGRFYLPVVSLIEFVWEI